MIVTAIQLVVVLSDVTLACGNFGLALRATRDGDGGGSPKLTCEPQTLQWVLQPCFQG